MGEFLRRSGGVNVASVEVDSVARAVDWGGGPSLVVVSGHVVFCFGHRGLRFFERALHTVCEVVYSFYLGWWLARLEAHAWVSACVEEERCPLSGGVDVVVVRELH